MKRILVFAVIALNVFLLACQDGKIIDKKSDIKEENKILVSNISDDKSIEEVKSALKLYLDGKSVDEFIEGVTDYNETIEKTSLNEKFEEKTQPSYDVDKISKLWSSKKGDFIGTNCRINTFTLLKNNIDIKDGKIDDSLLFLDKDAINAKNIFNQEQTEKFKRLFSKVKTENTKDIHIHAKKMKEHFSDIGFDENAKMISVVLHDNLDGDFLFIGHVGVLVEKEGKYLFLEKISFEEPFQAVKFNKKEDCYNYLFSKYKHYSDETTAKPFIMENDELVELEQYNKN